MAKHNTGSSFVCDKDTVVNDLYHVKFYWNRILKIFVVKVYLNVFIFNIDNLSILSAGFGALKKSHPAFKVHCFQGITKIKQKDCL